VIEWIIRLFEEGIARSVFAAQRSTPWEFWQTHSDTNVTIARGVPPPGHDCAYVLARKPSHPEAEKTVPALAEVHGNAHPPANGPEQSCYKKFS
jgi:hypothetical protein